LLPTTPVVAFSPVTKPPPLGPAGDARSIILQIGPLRLTGPGALVATFALLGAIIAALIYFRARILSSPLSISAALWIAFVIYWSVAARDTAQTKSRESRASRSVHSQLLNASLLLVFVPVPGLDQRVLPVGRWVVPIGISVHLASFLLAVSARRHLGRFWSGAITQKVGHELVRSGPYRFVRHPIYTAMLGMFLGMAIVSGDLHAFVAIAVITFAYWRKIRLEERNLTELFGAAYGDYRRRTRALVPWVI
jgi:protein-S-isoprenylcysteine O-methyltransferase Ste14